MKHGTQRKKLPGEKNCYFLKLDITQKYRIVWRVKLTQNFRLHFCIFRYIRHRRRTSDNEDSATARKGLQLSQSAISFYCDYVIHITYSKQCNSFYFPPYISILSLSEFLSFFTFLSFPFMNYIVYFYDIASANIFDTWNNSMYQNLFLFSSF